MTLKVVLPIKIVSVSNLREHYMVRAKRSKVHRHTAATMLRAAGKPPAPPVSVTLTRIGARTLDTDNLSSGCKAARDGIADWLGLDDGDERITWRYGQQKGAAGEFGLIVEVTV